MEAGAEIVNDVSATQWDRNMPATLVDLDCGVVLMHMRGLPEEWRSLPTLADPTDLVKQELKMAADNVFESGVKRERVVIDPGFGFGKNFEENYPLLARMDELHELRLPVLAGTSRKSFIGRALAGNGGDAALDDRVYGTTATLAIAIMKGVHIVRVHDVASAVHACRMADAILHAEHPTAN
jgi:dihydropteroate synthase